MANIAEHKSFPAIKQGLEGKQCVGVSAADNKLELTFEDGTVLTIRQISGPGADSNWYDTTHIDVSGGGHVEW